MKKLLSALSILLIATVVYAGQTVSVKYRDTPVDLNYFENQETSQSSFINGIWYDAENDYLIINLNDINYHYCGVPEEVWLYMKDYSAHGSYGSAYNSRLKGQYDCREGYVPEYYE